MIVIVIVILLFYISYITNRNGDPRSPIIKKWSQKLSGEKEGGNKLLFDVSERVEQIMWNEKKMFPNLGIYIILSPLPLFNFLIFFM